MFLSPIFTLYNKKIGETNFILGWVPISSFVNILGKTDDIEEQRTISEQDLPFAFFTKRLYKKIFIVFVPSIVYFSIGIVSSFLILKYQNHLWNIDYILVYLKEAFKAMFGNEKDILQFKILSTKYISENNIIVFSYFLISCILFFCTIFENLSHCLRLDFSESKIKKTAILVLAFLPVLFVIWKIPALIFKYYTLAEIFIYLIDFLLGIFFFGSILFFAAVFSFKLFKAKFVSFVLVIFLFVSCGKKEDVLLPKSNVSIVKNVEDLSPIYIFFRTEGKDTIADVNRKNSIISTNWIFNIDKRLPLRLVLPEVMKLQEKKRAEKAHKNEKAENYYSYADSIGKNLAFLPFTNVYYKMEKPNQLDSFFYFKKNGIMQFDYRYDFPKKDLENFINNLRHVEHDIEIIFSFDKNMSYEEYLQDLILIQKLKITKKGISINHEKEFVF